MPKLCRAVCQPPLLHTVCGNGPGDISTASTHRYETNSRPSARVCNFCGFRGIAILSDSLLQNESSRETSYAYGLLAVMLRMLRVQTVFRPMIYDIMPAVNCHACIDTFQICMKSDNTGPALWTPMVLGVCIYQGTDTEL